jgi:hypothetical protein
MTARAHASLPTLLSTCAFLTIIGTTMGCARVMPPPSMETKMSSVDATTAARPDTTVQGEFDTELHAAFDYAPDSRIIAVRYRLRNAGDAALAVFDRGDQHAIGIGRQKAGDVGIPRQVEAGGDVELIHAAAPLPEPEPTSPPTPVAIELAPGAELSGEFQFALKGLVVPKRLRWCVGVMRVGDAYMDSPHETKQGRLWRASFAVVDKQKMLCTPWYDVKTAQFES